MNSDRQLKTLPKEKAPTKLYLTIYGQFSQKVVNHVFLRYGEKIDFRNQNATCA